MHYLITENREVIYVHEDICKLVRDYYLRIFSNLAAVQEERVDVNDDVIIDEQNRLLTKDFSMEEFSVAIKQIHPDKSAGPDGLNPTFFQSFWKLVGKEVF